MGAECLNSNDGPGSRRGRLVSVGCGLPGTGVRNVGHCPLFSLNHATHPGIALGEFAEEAHPPAEVSLLADA